MWLDTGKNLRKHFKQEWEQFVERSFNWTGTGKVLTTAATELYLILEIHGLLYQ